MGFFQLMGLMDRNVKSVTDELMMGCGCLKIKKIYLIEVNWFFRGLLAMMSLFLSKKVMSRFVNLGTNWDKLYECVGGCDKVPVGFGPRGSGTVEDRWLGMQNHFAEKKIFKV